MVHGFSHSNVLKSHKHHASKKPKTFLENRENPCARILSALPRPVALHFMGGQDRACGLHPAQTFRPPDWSRCAGPRLGAPPSALTFAQPERALNRAAPAITRHQVEKGKRGSRERSLCAFTKPRSFTPSFLSAKRSVSTDRRKFPITSAPLSRKTRCRRHSTVSISTVRITPSAGTSSHWERPRPP
jgi:hypothetical protein